jgi:prepilin-type N-terminal cleavage/methylation domain-containing protein
VPISKALPTRSARPGFTLFETFIVLVIIGVVMAIGLPRIDAFKYRADASAVTVRSLLMQAQRDAVVGQHDLIVSIDTTKHRLILGYDKNNDGAVVVFERIRIQALPEGNKFSKPPTSLNTSGLNDYGSIWATELRTVSGYPSVIFRRDGSVSSALELYTTTSRAKATDYRVATVVQATGRTEYMRYTGTNWKRPQ